MITPPQWRENFRRRFRRANSWWIPAALLALTPKCVACVFGYASIGAMLGIGGPELCGAPGGVYGHWEASLFMVGTAGAIGLLRIRSRFASRHDEERPDHRQ
jgi:hypothetical protein